MRRLGRAALAATLALAGFVAYQLLRPGSTPPPRSPAGIASLEPVAISGSRQWVLIRGDDASKPVLLFLHGGPGAPMMPVAHLFSPELERSFVMVHWDQRGSGKSYDGPPAPGSLTLDRCVADTIELTEWLRARLHADKVFLVGHSWGAALGVLAAQRRPDLFYAYVGLGQVVDNPREEEIGLRFVRERAREHGDEQALRELADLKPPYLENPKQMLVERKWLARYGGDFHTGVSLPLLSDFDARWVWAALRSPEYSWGDLIRFELGFSQVRWALFREFKQLSLLRSVPRLEVPVYLLVGRYDYTTPFELVQEYFDRLDAPLGKHLVWFENSAHSPVLEEPERFAQVLIEQVLPEARAAR